MKIQRCKGMRDMSPAEMTVFHLVEEICRDCFLKWGYQEVRTPTIEYLHLFTSAGTLTPGMLGKVYSFLDWDGWSGERVVLRPDGTIPVARLYTEKMQEQGLARLFYAANMFTFEENGEKTRERWQCGAELIGAGSAVADAELLALSSEILQKLGLKGVELRLSHAGLIKALLEKIGLSPEEQHKLFDSILDGDADALARVSRESPELGGTLLSLLKLKGKSPGFLRNQLALLRQTAPEICAPLEDFLKTVAVLDELGIKYQINIASGTGFEYYTGIIFQYFTGREKIGGGGRYDALIPSMGGGNAPASGFALYLDRLMTLVKPASFILTSPLKVLVKALSPDAVKEAFNAAAGLRKAGFIAELDLDGRPADWTLEVKSGGALTLVNKAESVKSKIENINAAVALLEAPGAG
ncbi:MAG: ATP phosphoribosyltransferase regulatory subunit [Dehalococcoidales bacterium]|jgi:histidyl-tRNA synthetase